KSVLFMGLEGTVVLREHLARRGADVTQLVLDFLAAWFQDKWNSGLYREICHRWVGQAAVQSGRLVALEIVLPDIHEQGRVAAAVRSQVAEVERARAAAKAQLGIANAVPVADIRSVFEESR